MSGQAGLSLSVHSRHYVPIHNHIHRLKMFIIAAGEHHYLIEIRKYDNILPAPACGSSYIIVPLLPRIINHIRGRKEFDRIRTHIEHV